MSAQDDLDYRAYYDATYIRAWDLPPNKDVAVIIERVVGEEMKGKEKDAYRRPVVYFRGKKKGLVLNAGMGKAVKGMYGRFTRGWIGKPIAIYATTCDAFGETHDVVRVRPTPPRKQREPARPEPRQLPAAHAPNTELADDPEGGVVLVEHQEVSQ